MACYELFTDTSKLWFNLSAFLLRDRASCVEATAARHILRAWHITRENRLPS
jgi:hypothetical protein